MSKSDGVLKIGGVLSRMVRGGGDDVARAGSRTAPKIGAAAAGGAGLVGAGWLVNQALSGTRTNQPGSSGGSTLGGGGLQGQRAGLSSSRGFTAPANDNNVKKVSYNANGDFEQESLKLQAVSANSLSSIDNTVKNILKFSVAKATHDTRSMRELAIEGSNAPGLDPAAAFAAGAASAGGQQQGNGISPGLIAAVAAVGAGLFAMSKMKGFDLGGTPGSSPGGLNLPDMSQNSALGRGIHQAGMGLTGATYAGDAQRMLGGRTAPAAAPGAPANDNRRSVGQRLRSAGSRLQASAARAQLASTAGGMAQAAGGRGIQRVAAFMKSLKATPVARFPYVTSVFASIDPIIAAIDSGGQVNENVKKELVGAIATIIAGPAGIALGAALGAFVGIPATPVGMAVGAILGGIGGAVAALSAEFVAEQMFDLISGKISMGQFARNLGRGAMNGTRNMAAIAGGAVAGGALGAVRLARAGARAAAPAIASVAPAAAAAARGGLRLAAPTARSVAGLAVAGAVGGVGLVAASRSSAPSSPAVSTLNMEPSELLSTGRAMAEQYLGRAMTVHEWDYLIRAVYAESGRGGGGRENAMIMATILNRARNANGWSGGAIAKGYLRQGLTVLAVLYAKNQFQAVTGTRNNPRPSALFIRGPNQNELNAILQSVVQFLHKVPHGQLNFTAAAAGAYGAGTNIGFRDAMLRNGGQIVGGTVFNTSLLGENASQTVAPAAAPPAVAGSSAIAPASPSGNVLTRLGGALAGFATARPSAPTAMPTDEGGVAATGAAGDPNSLADRVTKQNRGVNIDGLNQGFKAKLAGLAGEYMQRTGRKLQVNSGYRSTAEQAALFRKYGPGRAARPGRSKHERGMAVDIQSNQLNQAAGMGLLSKYGFHRPVRGEAWHMELKGAGGSTPAGTEAHNALPRTGGEQNMALGAGRSINWAGTAAPSVGSYPDSEGTTPTSAISPATPETRQAEHIMAASIASEKKRMNIVVQNAQTQTTAAQTKTRNEKTDSSAPESVSSPVMAAYEYAAYWGVD